MQTYRVEFSHYDSGPQVNKLDQVPSDGHQMSLAGAGQGGHMSDIERDWSQGPTSTGAFQTVTPKTVFWWRFCNFSRRIDQDQGDAVR